MSARERAARGAICVLSPALIALLATLYFVPRPGAGGVVFGALAEGAHRATVPFFAATFLLVSALASYWYPDARHDAPTATVTRRSRGRAVGIGIVVVCAAAVAAVAIRTWAFEGFWVTSRSMLPTFDAGDRVLARKTASNGAKALQRGGVVVFTTPDLQGVERLVKRAIGLPGDLVEMRGGHPILNGWEVPSCDAGAYTYALDDGAITARLLVEYLDDATYLTLHGAHAEAFVGSYEVKEGEIFVLGDNRNGSRDSRDWGNGQRGGVAISSLVGEVSILLLGTRRDGSFDLSRPLAPLRYLARLEGVDARALERGVANCIRDRPESTRPPARKGLRSPLSAR